jgi:Flp pilus assembly protein TadD
VIERLLADESALARGELDAAERQFSLVAEADPRNAIAVVGLARITARRGDPDGAQLLVRRALEIDPDEAAAARLLGELDRPSAAREPAPTPEAAAVPREAGTSPKSPRPWWRRWLDRLRRRG